MEQQRGHFGLCFEHLGFNSVQLEHLKRSWRDWKNWIRVTCQRCVQRTSCAGWQDELLGLSTCSFLLATRASSSKVFSFCQCYPFLSWFIFNTQHWCLSFSLCITCITTQNNNSAEDSFFVYIAQTQPALSPSRFRPTTPAIFQPMVTISLKSILGRSWKIISDEQMWSFGTSGGSYQAHGWRAARVSGQRWATHMTKFREITEMRFPDDERNRRVEFEWLSSCQF